MAVSFDKLTTWLHLVFYNQLSNNELWMWNLDDDESDEDDLNDDGRVQLDDGLRVEPHQLQELWMDEQSIS